MAVGEAAERLAVHQDAKLLVLADDLHLAAGRSGVSLKTSLRPPLRPQVF